MKSLEDLHHRRLSGSVRGGEHEVPRDRLLTSTEVAEFLDVPVNSLKMWRYRRTGPPWLKVGRHVRYRRGDLERWLDGRACYWDS